MSQSLLTNSALECKVNGGATLVKQSFTDAVISYQGATSGDKVKLTNVLDPASASDAATKNYVDTQLSGVSLGLSWKDAVRVRTTANLAATYASGTLTASANGALPDIDGVSLAVDDRVLVMNQTDAAHNGIYKVASLGSASAKYGLDRTPDANALTGTGDVRRAATYVEEGSTYSGRGYTQSAAVSTLGSDDLVFHLFATISEVSATDGLVMSGKNIMVNTDSNRGVAIISDKIGITDKGIIQSLIGDGAVDAAQLADNCIIPTKLAAGCINNANRFTDEVISNAKLATDAISAVKVQTNAVEERHIKNSNVTRDKIADDAIDGTKIANDAVAVEHIANGAVTSLKIGGGQVKSTNIGSSEVKNSNLEDATITAQKLASNSVITSKIASGNVTTALLNQTSGAEAVSEDCIRDGAVTHDKLAGNCVEADNIKSGAITEVKLADNCVSERTLGTFNSFSVNGAITATAFIAGGSSAGQTAMSLARAVHTKVHFDNAFALTTDWLPLPNANAFLQFTYNDDIACVFPSWVGAFETDGTTNQVEAVMKCRFYKNDGSEALDSTEVVIDHFGFDTGQDQYYPEGSRTIVVKQSASGSDLRIGKIWVEVKKNANGSVVVPVNSDFSLIGLVVADDTSATTITY